MPESARERSLRFHAAAGGAPEPRENFEPEPDLKSEVRRRFGTRRTPNLAATRGDVIKLGKLRAVVLATEWRDPTWAVYYRPIIDRGSRLSSRESEVTFVPAGSAPQPLGRWIGDLEPGSHGRVEDAVPSDGTGYGPQARSTTTNRPNTGEKEGGSMPTVVKRSNKKGATTKKGAGTSKGSGKTAATSAKSNGGNRRTQADIDKLVPQFLKAIKAGETMRAVKQQFGFSDDGPIRAALYRAGYDSKGAEHGVEAGSIDASKAAGKKQVVKLRSEGAAWYALAYQTGLTEAEVKDIVKEAGGSTGRVYTRSEKPASGKTSAKGADAAAEEKASNAARKGSGRKVTRRAVKADPSNQG